MLPLVSSNLILCQQDTYPVLCIPHDIKSPTDTLIVLRFKYVGDSIPLHVNFLSRFRKHMLSYKYCPFKIVCNSRYINFSLLLRFNYDKLSSLLYYIPLFISYDNTLLFSVITHTSVPIPTVLISSSTVPNNLKNLL